MDPITAFGIAGNVIQVVDIGLKAASKGREIYKSGSLSQNRDIEHATQTLQNASRSLDESLTTASTTICRSKDDMELQKLAEGCQGVSDRLLSELKALKLDDNKRRKREAAKKVVKSIRKKDEIEELQRRLEDYRKALDTGILVRLCERFDASAAVQSDAFRGLGQAIQGQIIRLADESRLRNISEDHCKRFHESLHFPEITSRQEQIRDAHRQTFQWIFDDSGHALRKWDNFIQWLQKGHGVYWINGKAGSGKSTLMSYICADPRTVSALKIWASSEQLAVPTFFFWKAGSELQKSSVGLLRSLLYQTLDLYPKLIPKLALSQDLSQTQATGQCELKPLTVWTERRLLSAFQEVVDQKEISVKICCFIDGLDEFDGSQSDLIELVKMMDRNMDIKICLSSRPLRSLERAFEDSAKLKLQDLTSGDIKRYVVDKLQVMTRMQQLEARRPSGAYSISDRVVERADGVFLWVYLVVGQLVEGLQNEDDESQMEERLRLVPDTIEGIYGQMLNRVNKIYRKEAVLYFEVILQDEIPLVAMAFAEDKVLGHETIQYAGGLKEGDITSRCNSMRTRLLTRCAGLLECVDYGDADDQKGQDASLGEIEEPEASKYLNVCHSFNHRAAPEFRLVADDVRRHERTYVQFSHRTARDFLLESEHGITFLGNNSVPADMPYIWHFWAALRRFCIWSGLSNREDIQINKLLLVSHLRRIMNWANQAEREVGKAQKVLLETLDTTMARFTSLARDYNPSAETTHWTKLLPLHTYIGDFRGCYDIVGFAAYCGLHYFVLDALSRPEHGESVAYKSYLLGCTLALSPLDRGKTVLSSGRLQLIASLLEGGADPNTIVELSGGSKFSGFSMFLGGMWTMFAHVMEIRHPDEASDWASAIENLLSKGADPHLVVSDLRSSSYLALDGSAETVTAIELGLEMSVAWLLRVCLKSLPGFESVESILEEKEARESCHIEQIRVYRRSQPMVSYRVYRRSQPMVSYSVTKQESDYLMDAYTKWREGPRLGEFSGFEFTYSLTQNDDLALRLTKFLQDHGWDDTTDSGESGTDSAT